MNAESQQTEFDESLILAFSFLLKAYDFSSEHTEQSVPIWDIGQVMGLSETRAEEVASDLQEMNLLYYSSLAGDIALTSFGMSEVVLAQSQPLQPTTHFPPLANMSPQMMLPLSAAPQPGMARLVDQLEAFSEELAQVSESRFDLTDTIQLLDETLQHSHANEQNLIDELQAIKNLLQ